MKNLYIDFSDEEYARTKRMSKPRTVKPRPIDDCSAVMLRILEDLERAEILGALADEHALLTGGIK